MLDLCMKARMVSKELRSGLPVSLVQGEDSQDVIQYVQPWPCAEAHSTACLCPKASTLTVFPPHTSAALASACPKQM